MKRILLLAIAMTLLTGYRGHTTPQWHKPAEKDYNIYKKYKQYEEPNEIKKFERPWVEPKTDRWGKTKKDYELQKLRDKAKQRQRYRPLRDRIPNYR